MANTKATYQLDNLISLEELKKIMGNQFHLLTDEEVDEIINPDYTTVLDAF